MLLADALTLDAPRRSSDGYVRVHARGARAGVYQYLGAEVDPTGSRFKADQVVNVYRPAEEVFAADALGSFALKPITDDHPREAVNARNWRDHARGSIIRAGRETAQDGDYVGFELAFMDGTTVDKLDGGKRELSGGYACDVRFEDGAAPDGTPYQAVQSNIRGNHVALVAKGRAGPTCRIGDAATCDSIPLPTIHNQEKPVSRTLTVDGLPVNVADADAATATINRLVEQRDAATTKATTLEASAVTAAATIVAKDAEITKLTADLAAAKPTLQQLRDAGKAFAVIEGKAKAAGVAVTDAMDEAAIMKAVVDKAMPGNTYAGDHIKIAFDALTKDVKVDATVQSIGAPVVIGDALTAYQTDRAKQRRALSDAWKTPFNAADAAAA